jgi:tRNA 2-selenouridine synthase
MVEEVEAFIAKYKLAIQPTQDTEPKSILVHCWRGGMRSAGVAWLLDLYGFKVYTLVGGYKSYRQWARNQFEKPYDLKILGGYTGSGKTLILHQLQKQNISIIDLEGLANHKGSAFGALGEKPQPTQEMFENLLAEELNQLSNQINDDPTKKNIGGIFIEDESQRIGLLQIPNNFWNTMRSSPIFFIDIPFEERLDYLTLSYGKFEKEKLVNAIIRIQKRLGGLETKTAISFLLENNHKECFRILLTYYDKFYHKGLYNRENLPALLNKITCTSVDAVANTNILIHEKTTAL